MTFINKNSFNSATHGLTDTRDYYWAIANRIRVKTIKTKSLNLYLKLKCLKYFNPLQLHAWTLYPKIILCLYCGIRSTLIKKGFEVSTFDWLNLDYPPPQKKMPAWHFDPSTFSRTFIKGKDRMPVIKVLLGSKHLGPAFLWILVVIYMSLFEDTAQ